MADISAKHSDAAMALLTSNLGFFQTEIPADLRLYLESLLDYAYDDFEEMSIHLSPGTLRDDMDQMVHAAWMYRKGINGEGKTEMLIKIIRKRQVGNALADEEGSV